MSAQDELLSRYKYGAQYVTDYDAFRQQLLDRTVVPHQVEIQPASPRKEICWLKCPWCYGLSATDTGERLPLERAVEIMRQIAAGGVKKVIFAGYATDPLNCSYLEDLLTVVVDNGQVFGFNTKAIKTSDRLLELVGSPNVAAKSYMSISVDAGSNAVYNTVHGVTNEGVRLYDRVLRNVELLSGARQKGGAWFDISATYLINAHNRSAQEVSAFIRDFKSAGCNLLRFTFPQLPKDFVPVPGVIPAKDDVLAYTHELRGIIEAANSDACAVFLVDADTSHDIFRKPRTLPCFARFIYPTVGFDGWLYNCSQSSAPNFRSTALGNLATHDFWDLYYDYQVYNLSEYLTSCGSKLAASGCKCDRKEHIVNLSVRKSGVFDDVAAL